MTEALINILAIAGIMFLGVLITLIGIAILIAKGLE